MTVATDAGFVVGNIYYTKNAGDYTDGTRFVFDEDDGTSFPFFRKEGGTCIECFGLYELSPEKPEKPEKPGVVEQPNWFEVATYEQGTAFTFQKQLTASQIGRILAIAEEA